MRMVWGPAALLLAMMAACSSGATTPHPSPSPPVTVGQRGASPIPNGAYTLTITERDAERSGNGHLITLAAGIAGRYELAMEDGRYSVTLDGRGALPRPSVRGPGEEGAYTRYGFWVFLGIPPIGEGTYEDSATHVTFRSHKGACFQKGASASLLTGRYRWRLDRGRLTLMVAGASGNASGSGDGCLGRSFVFSAHPWSGEG